jgi:hypothetical protein
LAPHWGIHATVSAYPLTAFGTLIYPAPRSTCSAHCARALRYALLDQGNGLINQCHELSLGHQFIPIVSIPRVDPDPVADTDIGPCALRYEPSDLIDDLAVI